MPAEKLLDHTVMEGKGQTLEGEATSGPVERL